jgi:hypothetical protein
MAHPPENQFAAWLGEVHALAQERRHEVYLIADQSGLPRLGEARTLLQGMALRNILSSAPECEFDGASPLLVQTSGATPLRTARLARWLHVQGRHANCLAVLVSPLDITALHAQLRQRTELMLPGNLRMVLRYFDTRSLPLLPRLLTEPQYAAFTACAAEWHYLDRAGEVQRLPAPTQPFAWRVRRPAGNERRSGANADRRRLGRFSHRPTAGCRARLRSQGSRRLSSTHASRRWSKRLLPGVSVMSSQPCIL